MPVTIDATVGGASANSYVTLAVADAYFANRLYATLYTGKSDDDRSKALIMATQRIDQENYLGYAVSQTQALDWPRSGVQVPGEPYGRYYETTEIPQEIQAAQCEAALWIAGSDVLAAVDGNIDRLKVGPIELDFRSGVSSGVLPDTVTRLLRGLTVGAGGAALVRS